MVVRPGWVGSLVVLALVVGCSTEEDSGSTAPAGSESASGAAGKAGASGKGGASQGGAGAAGAAVAGAAGASAKAGAGGSSAAGAGAGGSSAAGASAGGSSAAGAGGSSAAGAGGNAAGSAGATAGGAGAGGAATGGAGAAGSPGGAGQAGSPGGATCENGFGDAKLDAALLGKNDKYNSEVLISQQPDLSWKPSTIYRWQDFLQALCPMNKQGVGEFSFWLGDPGDGADVRYRYALVNIAAFMAQSMKETIKYDACDENNWDSTNGYKISNACGQLGQNYENYDCDMACPKAPQLQITARTHASWYGAPGPLFCAPNSALISAGVSKDGTTGYWDYSSDCWPYPATQPGFVESSEQAYLRPACEVYAGQKAGKYVFDGSGGSVEGCCWWGRGVIQTTGRCNFGKLNHYLGQSHLGAQFPKPASALYPDVNFCEDPEVICTSTKHPELKWIAGLFYWMSSVQVYDKDGWSYIPKLRAFVDGGMTDTSFIDSVSGIVNRGCHNPPCGTGPLDGGPERRENFDKVLKAMGL